MITVTGLSKRFGAGSTSQLAVDDLTFDVAAGRVTGFVGPNGAGKSTTMRMMVGLVRPDAGDVRYRGVTHRELPQPSKVIGAVLNPRCMHPGRTALQHLRATAAYGGFPLERAEVVLADVGLSSVADRRAGSFSLGMRQRLALAGALVGEPQVLLLDEPSNGLDPEGIRWLRTRLATFAAVGGTVFVSSHLISELSMFADDLVVIGDGRLLAAESLDDLTRRVDRCLMVTTPHSEELVALLHRNSIDARCVDGRIHVRGTTADHVSKLAYDARIRLVEVGEVGTSLEDILLELTQPATEFTAN